MLDMDGLSGKIASVSLGPPNPGTIIMCILCAHEKPYGVWDSKTTSREDILNLSQFTPGSVYLTAVEQMPQEDSRRT